MSDRSDAIARLHATFARRDTPEAVAAMIIDAMPDLEGQARARLSQVVLGSLDRRFGWSSMATQFRRPDGVAHKIAKAKELAGLFMAAEAAGLDEVDNLEDFGTAFARLIGKTPGRSSFKADRLNGEARAAAGLTLSRRRYVKLFRLAGRLERRLGVMRREEAKLRLTLVSKAALAPELTIEQLGGHVPTAAFVAYYAARMKLRSEFTAGAQQRPFDHAAAALLRLCEDDPETRWYAVAHVFPRADVLARLPDEEKGLLLGRWYAILAELAERLEEAYRRTEIDLDTMIVKRGNDSTTWNLLAAAWNRARDHWIACVSALGMDELFDSLMPGKVMRLMAGDVAFWHRSLGKGVHPDTRVWAELPKPWEVLRGEAAATRETVAAACRRNGIDPEASGWSAPRPRTWIETAKPTPELVHGVAVNNPWLAKLLRDGGVFSGRSVKRRKLFGLLRGD